MKYKCEINEELQKEANKNSKRNAIIMLIIGAVGLVAYVIVSTFIEHYLLEILSWVSAFLLVFGIFLLVLIKNTNKKMVEKKMVDEYELFEEYLTVDSYQNGEKIVSLKAYYKDLIKIRETENYIFLYPNKQSAYPVPKKQLTDEELVTVRNWVQTAMKNK